MALAFYVVFFLFLTFANGKVDNGDIPWSELASKDFATQVDIILHQIKKPRSEVEKYQDLIASLKKELDKFWPEYEVTPFGSIPNGLGLIWSDIDLFITLPENVQKNLTVVLQKISGELRKNEKIYSKIRVHAYIAVPLLKFMYNPTNQNADVTFSNFDSKQETELFNYWFKTDFRAYNLMLLVKYWSRVHKLAIKYYMPNFLWYILVAFYLQNVNILPPIVNLQSTVKPDMFKNWNLAFEPNYNYYYSDNNNSLYTLLGGFFTFYANYDFENNVISTFVGKSIPRKLFENVNTVPDVFNLYKFNLRNNLCRPLNVTTAFCVQRPFEHDCNNGMQASIDLTTKIKNYFKKAAKIFREVSEKEFIPAIFTNEYLI